MILRSMLVFFSLAGLMYTQKLWARPENKDTYQNLVKSYMLTAEKLMNTMPDSAIALSDRALSLARRQGDNYFVAKAYFLLGAGFYNKLEYSQSKEFYLKALRQFEHDDSIADVTRTWLNMSLLYRDMGDIVPAVEYITKAVEVFDKTHDIAGLARAYYLIGGVYWRFGQLNEAVLNYQKAADTWTLAANTPERLKSLTNKGFCYRDAGKLAESVATFNEIVRLAEGQGDTLQLISALRNQSAISTLRKDTTGAFHGYQRALRLATALSDSALMATTCEDIGKFYRTTGSTEKALFYYNKALQYRITTGSPRLLASVYYQLGLLHADRKDYPQALQQFFLSLDKASEANDKSGMAATYKSIAAIFDYTSNYVQSARYCGYAMEIEKELNEPVRLSLTHIMKGNALRNLRQFPEALAEYNAALELRLSRQVTADVAGIYNNIGNVYLDMLDYRKAFGTYQTALEAAKLVRDTLRMAEVFNNLGNAWRMSGNNGKALEYFMVSAEMYKTRSHWYGYSLALRKAGEVLLDENRLVDAFSPFDKAYYAGVGLNDFELIRHAAKGLSDYYQAVGNSAKALAWFRKFSDYTDSVTVAKSNRLLTETQVNYELGKLENKLREARDAVEVLETRSALREMQIRRERMVRWFVTAFALLALGAMAIIFYYLRKNRRINHLLSEKIAVIEQINQQLKSSQDELKSLLATRDKFFSIIAHDLKNPISGLMMASESLVKRSQEYNEEEKQIYHQAMLDSSKHLYALLENLLQWSRSQTGRMAYNPRTIDIAKIVQATVDVLAMQAAGKGVRLVNELAGSLEVVADADMITTVVRNLISNAVKFTPQGGTVMVRATVHAEALQLEVSDTGVGMTKEEMAQLFRIDSEFSMPGTNNESGTGLGLVLCREFVSRHQGTVQVDSKPGAGSVFKIILPQNKYGENKI